MFVKLELLFQPTLPARGATTGTVYQPGYFLFQPTLPARGATAAMIATLSPKKTFQPTLPARGATFPPLDEVKGLLVFQPTLPARGATCAKCFNARVRVISTHAPRTGSDAPSASRLTASRHFNPRSPHGERLCFSSASKRSFYFNPRSPHGERLLRVGVVRKGDGISTHAPRTGSDRPTSSGQGKPARFQPTLPARGATDWRGRHRRCGAFQPTLPARGATFSNGATPSGVLFQPTLPARGATRCTTRTSTLWRISTHAPRTGSD